MRIVNFLCSREVQYNFTRKTIGSPDMCVFLLRKLSDANWNGWNQKQSYYERHSDFCFALFWLHFCLFFGCDGPFVFDSKRQKYPDSHLRLPCELPKIHLSGIVLNRFFSWPMRMFFFNVQYENIKSSATKNSFNK